MKTSTTVAIAAALFLLFPLVTKAVAGSDLSVDFDKIKSFGIKGINLVMTLQFKINNPTNQAYTIKALTGDVYVNGSDIGNANTYENVSVAPISQTLYTVQVQVETIGMASDLLEVLKGASTRNLTLQFKGSINVDGFVLPVNSSIGL